MYEKEWQLPYDKCIEIDNEVDTLLEEDKRNKLKEERKNKLACDSNKSRHLTIYKWLGFNFMFEYLSGCALWIILFIPILFLFIAIAIYDGDDDFFDKFLNVIGHIIPSPEKYIKKKMSKDNYMIPSNVIDCPMVVKQKLYSWLDKINKYYLATKDGNLFLYNRDFEHGLQITSESCEDVETPLDKEYPNETKYLLGQLKEGELYSVTDIIVDKQLKYDNN